MSKKTLPWSITMGVILSGMSGKLAVFITAA